MKLPADGLFLRLMVRCVGSLDTYIRLSPCPNLTDRLEPLVSMFGMFFVSRLFGLFPKIRLCGY